MSNNRKLKKENDQLKEKLNEISLNSEPNNMSEELERLKKEHESNMTKLQLELKAQSELNITLNEAKEILEKNRAQQKNVE
ncbi:hypothetical protein HHI36_014958 [Cryptolaemus montrouzieri]|uniref:Uncharacterized protein n=1 Tax=Cryptolaemus montrouzieri TaxID=559131 RepID=A0ABD2N4J0_9CUCU